MIAAGSYWITTGRFWLMIVKSCEFRFVPAEPPCWKGEINIGRLVFGWQRQAH